MLHFFSLQLFLIILLGRCRGHKCVLSRMLLFIYCSVWAEKPQPVETKLLARESPLRVPLNMSSNHTSFVVLVGRCLWIECKALSCVSKKEVHSVRYSIQPSGYMVPFNDQLEISAILVDTLSSLVNNPKRRLKL